MNLHLTNTHLTTETFILEVPDTLDLHNPSQVLAAIQARMPSVTHATVGKGYLEASSKARATVWVQLAKAPAKAKASKAEKPAATKAEKRYTLADLTTAEKRAVTAAANVMGVRRDVAARKLGLLG